jgi:excisionase family DNA binding protein
MSVRVVQPPNDPDRGVTLQEAASRLGITPATARKLVERGYLDAWRIHSGPKESRIRIALSSVLEYRERYAINGHAPARLARRRPRPVAPNASDDEAIRHINSYLGRRS